MREKPKAPLECYDRGWIIILLPHLRKGNETMELKNKGVLVTGGASGLGAACARLLSQAGAKVVIADLNREAGEALAREVGDVARFVQANVTEEASMQAAVQAAVEHGGGIF